jgi:hypothetical protein
MGVDQDIRERTTETVPSGVNRTRLFANYRVVDINVRSPSRANIQRQRDVRSIIPAAVLIPPSSSPMWLLAAGLLRPTTMKDSLEWLLVACTWLIALVSLGLKRMSDWRPSARGET